MKTTKSYRRGNTTKPQSSKSKRFRNTQSIDNLIDESLLRQAMDIDYEIKLLQEKREKVRSMILEQMDSAGITISKNDIGTVCVIQREFSHIGAANVKKNSPELFRELDRAGFITRANQRYCVINPKEKQILHQLNQVKI